VTVSLALLEVFYGSLVFKAFEGPFQAVDLGVSCVAAEAGWPMPT